jgi:hypothetical protein
MIRASITLQKKMDCRVKPGNDGKCVSALLRPRRFCTPRAPLIDPEAITDCGGAARASHDNGGWSVGANAMRTILSLGLLIALCASANAARVHHSKPRHLVVRHSHGVPPRFVVTPKYDDTPSYDDPSKWGGGAP